MNKITLTCILFIIHRVQITEEGNLVISEVRQTDEGDYICYATNEAGKKETKPAILNVIGKLAHGLKLSHSLYICII